MSSSCARGIEADDALHEAIGTAYDNIDLLSGQVLDPLTLNVIAMTSVRPMTVRQIARGLGVSEVTTYSLVNRLHRLGILVEVGKHRTSTHGASKLYSTIVKNGTIAIKDGGIEVICVYRDGSVCVRRLGFGGRRTAPRKRRSKRSK